MMSTTDSLEGRIRSLIAEERPSLLEIRHDLHENPELAYEEERTSTIVCDELTKAGIPFEAGLAGGTGVLGHLPGASDRSIALRADMDALPIHEETGLGYASKTPGKMHACGHDGHTTMLIGAARVLARLAKEDTLPHGVTFLFQPAEEGGAGAKRMCEDGALDGSRIGTPVEAIFGQHGYTFGEVETVTSRVGPMLAAADTIQIEVRGTGGHAAMPHTCVDPVLCASSIIQSLQSIVSRNTDPLDSAVISITQMKAGEAFNVIPDLVTISGTVRSLKDSTREMLEERISILASGIAAAHGCTAQANYTRGYPITSNDPDAVARFIKVASASLGQEHVLPLENPVMGGEDFSFYGEHVPACFFFLGLLPRGEMVMPSLHNARFDFNDEALATGIDVFVHLAMSSA
jgi:hippurate hydrolase